MRQVRGYTWTRRDTGVKQQGFIAQEIQKILPSAVFESGTSLTMRDGEVIDNVLAIDTVGATAALHHEAILALMDEIESLKARLGKYESMAG